VDKDWCSPALGQTKENRICNPRISGSIKLMKGKAPKKQSLHGKIAASVLLELTPPSA